MILQAEFMACINSVSYCINNFSIAVVTANHQILKTVKTPRCGIPLFEGFCFPMTLN